MSDDMHSDYGGETLEALREREKNPHLAAVSPGRMTQLVKRYTRALCKPFREITEERYYDLLECLPPEVRITQVAASHRMRWRWYPERMDR